MVNEWDREHNMSFLNCKRKKTLKEETTCRLICEQHVWTEIELGPNWAHHISSKLDPKFIVSAQTRLDLIQRQKLVSVSGIRKSKTIAEKSVSKSQGRLHWKSTSLKKLKEMVIEEALKSSLFIYIIIRALLQFFHICFDSYLLDCAATAQFFSSIFFFKNFSFFSFVFCNLMKRVARKISF